PRVGARQFGLGRLQGSVVFRGLGSRLFQTLLSELTRAFGGLIARLQHFCERLKEHALQIKVQQDYQQKGRHCSQQYSAQGVQHGIHDVRRRKTPSNCLAEYGSILPKQPSTSRTQVVDTGLSSPTYLEGFVDNTRLSSK